MPKKRILTTELITEKAKAAFEEHGPGLSLQQFARLSGLSVGIIQLRLGSWLQFKESLGLNPAPACPARPTHQPDQILRELSIVAATRPRLSLAAFTKATGYSEKTVVKHFGSWSNLKRAGRLSLASPGRARTHIGVLLADFARVTEAVGRIPTENQYAHRGRFSVQTLTRHLGPWRTLGSTLELFLGSLAEHHPTAEGRARVLRELQDPGFRVPDEVGR